MGWEEGLGGFFSGYGMFMFIMLGRGFGFF